jgi:membrane-bound inhibitor of C-type lysozyme
VIRRALVLSALSACTMAAPETETPVPPQIADGTFRYSCTDGSTLPVTYGHEGDQAKLDLIYKGKSFLLYAEPAQSGARYGWPSDGSSYVWLSDGAKGTLLWKDETAKETQLLACTLKQ